MGSDAKDDSGPLPRLTSDPSLLVVGVIGGRGPWNSLAWEVLTRVEPRLQHLIRLTDPAIPMPTIERVHRGNARLDAALKACERIILVSRVQSGGAPGSLTCWHHETRPLETREAETGFALAPLSALRLTAPRPPLGFHHLPLWLEDELPAGGIDFVGIEVPHAPSEGTAVRGLRRHLPLMTAAVTGVLWRIMRERGGPDQSVREAAA